MPRRRELQTRHVVTRAAKRIPYAAGGAYAVVIDLCHGAAADGYTEVDLEVVRDVLAHHLVDLQDFVTAVRAQHGV